MKCILAAAVAVFTFTASASASTITVYDEGVQGDFSGTFTAPTPINLVVGQNRIVGATGALSTGTLRDYFTFTIPVGLSLNTLTLVSSSITVGNFAFLGIEAGPAFTFDPTTPDVTQLLGWIHFSPANNGTNILPAIGSGLGAIHFQGPLPAGQYSVWIQDTNVGVSSYELVAEVVPEPGTMLLMLSGLGVAARARRRSIR